jgi:hypothetical protein
LPGLGVGQVPAACRGWVLAVGVWRWRIGWHRRFLIG